MNESDKVCQCCGMGQSRDMGLSTMVKKLEDWSIAEDIKEDTKYDGEYVCGYCVDAYVSGEGWPEHLDGRGVT